MTWELNDNINVDTNGFLGTSNNEALIIKANTDNAPANVAHRWVGMVGRTRLTSLQPLTPTGE